LVPLPSNISDGLEEDFKMGRVIAVSSSTSHRFSKTNQPSIELIANHGVAGDAHAGATVKHRSRVAADPTQPNLRQVHLIHRELFDELANQGYRVTPGDLGDNVTTLGIDLLSLPRDTLLQLGESAVVKVTGLRNPCQQLNGFQPGLMEAVLGRDEAGNLVRKSGIMGIVITSGVVKPGDDIVVSLPEPPHVKLERV
jgi:MOSC domain-containing protein YiiM